MDLRIEKTYRALLSAFTELLEEKRYDEVTVAELCERAMIRRTTFYKHFADKDEFFDFFLASVRDEFWQSVRKADARGGGSAADYGVRMFRELMDFLASHERLVANVVESKSSAALIESLGGFMVRDIEAKLKSDAQSGVCLPADPATMAQFASGGMLRAVIAWWERGRSPEGLESIAALVRRCLSN